jgi:hypothetical protein
VLVGSLGLSLKAPETWLDLGDDVVDALQVMLCFVELAQSVGALVPVVGDSGRLLEECSALLCAKRQH